MSLIFPLKYFHKSFGLIMVTVMLQQSQITNATEVGSKHDVWDFPQKLPENSTDPLGSRYPQPISELSYGDSASALCSKDMIN